MSRSASPPAALVLALVLAVPARAQTLDLDWMDCGGPTDASFVCDTNAGEHRLYSTFVPPARIEGVVGITTRITVIAAGGALPSWWQMVNGECRTAAIQAVDLTTAPILGCANPFADASIGLGFIGYNSFVGGDDRASLDVVFAVPVAEGVTLESGVRVVANGAALRHTKTIGFDACPGCEVAVCLVADSIQVETLAASYVFANREGESGVATWQGGAVPGTPCSGATPARNATWGRVKATYR